MDDRDRPWRESFKNRALAVTGHYWLDLRCAGGLAHLVAGEVPAANGDPFKTGTSLCGVQIIGRVYGAVDEIRACASCVDVVLAQQQATPRKR